MGEPQVVGREHDTLTYEFGEYCLVTDERLLKRDGEIVRLPPKVIDLLVVLVEAGGRVISKDELMQRVWGETFVEETNLTHNISLLRRTLGEKKNGEKFIETIPRRGYRFAADVRRVDGDDFEVIAFEKTATHILIEEESETKAETQTKPTAEKAGGFGRKRLLAVVWAVVLILTMTAGFWIWKGPGETRAKSFQISEIKRVTASGRATLSAVSADGKFVAYVTEANRRQSLWLRNISTESDIPILSDSAAPLKSVKFGPGDRIYFVMRDVIYHVPMLGGPVQKVLDVAGGMANQVFTFAPDGKRIAFMRITDDSSVSAIYIADTDGKNERELVSTRHPKALFRSPAWSPDGAVIAMPIWNEDSMAVSLINVADGTISLLPTPKFSFIEQAEWLPDGHSLLALVEDGELWRISYPDGVSTKLSDELTRFSSISLAKDGETLIATKQEQDGHIWVLPVGSDAVAKQLTRGFDKNDGGMGLDWLSNDTIRYEAGRTGQSWTIDIEGRNASKMVAHPTYFSSISSDGKFLVFQYLDENGLGLFRANTANGELKRLTTGSAIWTQVSPDGKWVVYTNYKDDISIWKVPIDGGEPEQVSRLSGYAHSPSVSPDGKRIAFVWWESPKSGAPAKIVVVSFENGSLITTLSAPVQEQLQAGNFNKEAIEWTPDGQAIDFIQLRDGVSNIWRQALDGSPPVQITFFETGRIANFAYSPDYKNLALSRGNFTSDVFLIKNSK